MVCLGRQQNGITQVLHFTNLDMMSITVPIENETTKKTAMKQATSRPEIHSGKNGFPALFKSGMLGAPMVCKCEA